MNADPHDVFKSCGEVWGGTTLRTEKTRSKVYEDVFYLPFSPATFFDRYADWGVYDRHGCLIAEAAYRRHGSLVGQQEKVDLARFDFVACDRFPARYGGPIIPHYGHFLLSSIARSWAPRDEGTTIFHSEPHLFAHRSPFILELCDAMRMNSGNATSFHAPTRFKELTIAEPCVEEQGYVYPILKETGALIGACLRPRPLELAIAEGSNVFFSKTSVASGVTHFSNEIELEKRLQDAGFHIVHPEKLSVYEQVQIFKNAGSIVGFEGSAFHTQVLYPQATARRLVMSPMSFLNSNFILLDRAWQTEATYADISDQVEARDAPAAYFRSYALRDVRGLADKICAWAHAAKGPSMRARPQPVRRHANNLDGLEGEPYTSVLAKIRDAITPATYFEIGTLHGETLKISNCKSVAVDPGFRISQDVIGGKPLCCLYQLASDDFFDAVDPRRVLDGPIDLAFLDGMHRCEFLLRDFLNTERFCSKGSVIVLHDCVPVELPMTSRDQNAVPAEDPGRGGWWTGDVWKTALTLKEYRRDLDIFTIDAQPTGLVVITNLAPGNADWRDEYDRLLPIMNAMECSLQDVHARLQVEATGGLLPKLHKARSAAAAASTDRA